MVPARFAAYIGSRHGVIHGFIPGVVGLIHQLYISQVLYAERRFPAGNQQADRITLLNPQRLAILAVGPEDVLHGLSEPPRVRKLAGVLPLRKHPGTPPL